MRAIVFIWIVAVVSAGMGFIAGRGFRREAADVARNALAVQNYWKARTAPGAGSEPEESDAAMIAYAKRIGRDHQRMGFGGLPSDLTDAEKASLSTGWDATREDEQRQQDSERASSLADIAGGLTAADIDWQEVERRRIAAEKRSSIAQGAMVDEARGHIMKSFEQTWDNSGSTFNGFNTNMTKVATGKEHEHMLGPATRLPPADEAKIIGELWPETRGEEFRPGVFGGPDSPENKLIVEKMVSDLTAKPER